MKEHLEKAFTKLKTTIDEDGRVYSIDTNDENKVSFLYKGESTILGKLLVKEDNLLYSRFEDERNIFHHNQLEISSWAINYKIFEVVDMIIYTTIRYTYKIPKIRAQEFGILQKINDSEIKIYVSIKYWEKRHNGVDKIEERRRNLLGDSWYEVLKAVISSPFMSEIGKYLYRRRQLAKIYPDAEDVFKAFKLCSFEHTKVIIIGQDPYNDGVASGLAFAFKGQPSYDGAKSLHLIYDEVETDIYGGFKLEFDYSLEPWANQGVLLLNTHLTVEHGKPLSHQMIGWKRFAKITIYELLRDKNPKVFMLWGSVAQSLIEEILVKKPELIIKQHLFLKAKHPAADIRNTSTHDFKGDVIPDYPRTFRGCKHFSQANTFLKKNNRKEINW